MYVKMQRVNKKPLAWNENLAYKELWMDYEKHLKKSYPKNFKEQ